MRRLLTPAPDPYDVVAAAELAAADGAVIGVNEVKAGEVTHLAVYLEDADVRDEQWWASVVAAHDGTAGEQRKTAAAAAAANRATLEARADAALADLRTYINLETPTAGQTQAAVKLLCRVAVGLIRLVLRRFDSTD